MPDAQPCWDRGYQWCWWDRLQGDQCVDQMTKHASTLPGPTAPPSPGRVSQELADAVFPDHVFPCRHLLMDKSKVLPARSAVAQHRGSGTSLQVTSLPCKVRSAALPSETSPAMNRERTKDRRASAGQGPASQPRGERQSCAQSGTGHSQQISTVAYQVSPMGRQRTEFMEQPARPTTHALAHWESASVGLLDQSPLSHYCLECEASRSAAIESRLARMQAARPRQQGLSNKGPRVIWHND